jgi:hypothetical protein
LERVVGKVEAGDEVFEKAAHEEVDGEVRGLQVVVGTGDGARFDGGEMEFAEVIRGDAAEAREVGVGARLRRFGMREVARRVGLPDFEDGVRDRLIVAVEDATVNGDAFARDFGRAEIVRAEAV